MNEHQLLASIPAGCLPTTSDNIIKNYGGFNMGIFDSFREKRKKELREYQQQFNADKQTMIEKYQEYEKQGLLC